MSKITFLIGNGFDLACGLKSRYIDSYDEYIHISSNSNTIDEFKRTIEKDIHTWADFEMKLAEYAHSFKKEEDLVECIRDYTTFLNDYLTKEQAAFCKSFKGNSVIEYALRQTIARGLAQFYTGLTQNDIRAVASSINDTRSCTYQFINFNYTNVFDELVKPVFLQGDINGYTGRSCTSSPIIHIHGRLDNDVILGVDNEAQLAKLPYQLSRRGKRNIIKSSFLENYDNKRLNDALNYIKSSDVICAFGLALGESDLSWRKAIAEWLVDNQRNHLVFYNHSLATKKYPVTAITQKMDDEEDYKDYLLELLYADSIEHERVGQVYKQIHVPTGYSIFHVKETIIASRIESIEQQKRRNSFPKENGVR